MNKDQLINIAARKIGAKSYLERFEVYMAQTLASKGIKTHLIMERDPACNTYRWECKPLGWTMYHDLQKNLEFLNQYK